jgi:hypothetical protein
VLGDFAAELLAGARKVAQRLDARGTKLPRVPRLASRGIEVTSLREFAAAVPV